MSRVKSLQVHRRFRQGRFGWFILRGTTVASQFVVRNLAADGTRQEKHNCNFFWVKNGQISAVSVYMTGMNTLT